VIKGLDIREKGVRVLGNIKVMKEEKECLSKNFRISKKKWKKEDLENMLYCEKKEEEECREESDSAY
jgi:hypothetical protein